jgi:hypothetical protein
MVAARGALYAVEPNHGEIARIGTGGHVSRVIDVSASQGHVVPTALAYHRGDFYVGNLGKFPQDPGTSKVWKVTPGGRISVAAAGSTWCSAWPSIARSDVRAATRGACAHGNRECGPVGRDGSGTRS